MPYTPINPDDLVVNVVLVIPIMLSLALMTTNALKATTIVLVIVDYTQIFQVRSAVHAKLDKMEMAYSVLMLTNAMLEVPTVM